MSYPAPFDAQTPGERQAVALAHEAVEVARQHVARHDQEGSFPVEGLEVLARNGYLALSVPVALGGGGCGVADLVLGNLELARGDASLALVVAMHNTYLGRMREAGVWPAEVYARVASESAAQRSGIGGLINSVATEPELGSPSRGGLPRTRAERTATGWRLTGQKTFSSGAPVLRWGVVSATVSDRGADRVANFLVPLAAPGVRVEPSWDTLGMRATRSDTLVFHAVALPADAELPRAAEPLGGGPEVPHERAWWLSNMAVYLGIAEAARDAALAFAQERRPTALGGKSIASTPQIRQRLGALDAALYPVRALLVATARTWDGQPDPDQRRAMDGALISAKLAVAATAVAVTDQAMRLVGGSSLARSLPLERFFRDVRGGLHHPPQEDLGYELLARTALPPEA